MSISKYLCPYLYLYLYMYLHPFSFLCLHPYPNVYQDLNLNICLYLYLYLYQFKTLKTSRAPEVTSIGTRVQGVDARTSSAAYQKPISRINNRNIYDIRLDEDYI